jgi:uncharacterized protein YktA (UPF0223 family)
MNPVDNNTLQIPHNVPQMAQKRPSKFERIKKIIQGVLVSLKGISLSISVFKGATSIAACVCKFSKPLKSALSFLKIPSVIQNTISSTLSCEEIRKTRILAKDLSSSLQAYKRSVTQDAKEQALSRAFETIDKVGIKEIAKKISLSKEGTSVLKKRVNDLRAHIKNHSVTQDDEQLIKISLGRVHVHLGMSIANLAVRCVGIATGIVALVPGVPRAGAIVVASVLAACAVEELAMWGLEKLLLNMSPFDPSSKCPAYSALCSMSKGVLQMFQKASLVFSRKNSPQTAALA